MLDHKRHIEEEKKNILGEVQGRINKEWAAIQSVKDKRKTLYSGDAKRQYTPAETAMRSMYFSGMDSFVRGAKSRIEAMQPELEAARKAYIEAYKQRRIFEKLKEKHKKEFEEKQRHAEMRTLDETGRTIFQQQRRRDSNA